MIRFGLLLVGLGCLGHGLWLPVKAEVAQLLLSRAWKSTIQGAEQVHPWPWADSWPIARLTVPRLGIDQVVLAGTDGESLAFGPGYDQRTDSPGSDGNTALAGHRDSHFRFLQQLRRGDAINMQATGGAWQRYQVDRVQVVDQDAVQVLQQTPTATLTLITCYPFGRLTGGGRQRYIVRAVGASSSLDSSALPFER